MMTLTDVFTVEDLAVVQDSELGPRLQAYRPGDPEPVWSTDLSPTVDGAAPAPSALCVLTGSPASPGCSRASPAGTGARIGHGPPSGRGSSSSTRARCRPRGAYHRPGRSIGTVAGHLVLLSTGPDSTEATATDPLTGEVRWSWFLPGPATTSHHSDGSREPAATGVVSLASSSRTRSSSMPPNVGSGSSRATATSWPGSPSTDPTGRPRAERDRAGAARALHDVPAHGLLRPVDSIDVARADGTLGTHLTRSSSVPVSVVDGSVPDLVFTRGEMLLGVSDTRAGCTLWTPAPGRRSGRPPMVSGGLPCSTGSSTARRGRGHGSGRPHRRDAVGAGHRAR